MPSVAHIVAWEIRGFLLTVAAVVASGLLSGEINTKNLLHGRVNDTGQPIVGANGEIKSRKTTDTPYLSPERVQLLLLTLGAALYYLNQVLDNPKPGSFPPIPNSWTATLMASNVVYLGGKAMARFWPWTRNANAN